MTVHTITDSDNPYIQDIEYYHTHNLLIYVFRAHQHQSIINYLDLHNPYTILFLICIMHMCACAF